MPKETILCSRKTFPMFVDDVPDVGRVRASLKYLSVGTTTYRFLGTVCRSRSRISMATKSSGSLAKTRLKCLLCLNALLFFTQRTNLEAVSYRSFGICGQKTSHRSVMYILRLPRCFVIGG